MKELTIKGHCKECCPLKLAWLYLKIQSKSCEPATMNVLVELAWFFLINLVHVILFTSKE